MCAIKNAIIDGTYPVSKKIYVHPAEGQINDYFINDEEIAKFNREREQRLRDEKLTKDLEEDHRDAWLDNEMTLNAY